MNKKKVEIRIQRGYGIGQPINEFWSSYNLVVDSNILKVIAGYPMIEIEGKRVELGYRSQYQIMRTLYYNENSSRWASKKLHTDLLHHDIDIHNFISELEILFKKAIYFFPRSNKSSKKLINQLKNYSGIKLFHNKNDVEFYLQSLQELRNWKQKYVKGSDKDFLKFIHHHIDFPFSITTLKKYFYLYTEKK